VIDFQGQVVDSPLLFRARFQVFRTSLHEPSSITLKSHTRISATATDDRTLTVRHPRTQVRKSGV
jgi:hypothetical protein